jgi:hypothetical protein
MTVKVVRLKSGENLIAEIDEMCIGEDANKKVIGYFLKKPCVVLSRNSKPSEIPGKTSLEINMYPWIPIAKEDIIPITVDWVITIIDPIDSLKENYIKEVLSDGKDYSSSDTDEQDSSDNAN